MSAARRLPCADTTQLLTNTQRHARTQREHTSTQSSIQTKMNEQHQSLLTLTNTSREQGTRHLPEAQAWPASQAREQETHTTTTTHTTSNKRHTHTHTTTITTQRIITTQHTQ